ncbi:MAG: hypothetical protein K0R10_2563 [Alphaproteobacteria bacterium]|jgi:hypothetical protein|nr:hypothetical protein [Alphaproteobacteria bacterium]
MAAVLHIAGDVGDWLDARAAAESEPFATAQEISDKAVKIQSIFDELDKMPTDTQLVRKLAAEIGYRPVKDGVVYQAAQEMLRRYTEEFMPEVQRRQPMTPIGQGELISLEGARSLLSVETSVLETSKTQPLAPGSPENNLRLNNIPYRRRAGEVVVMGDVDFNDREMLPDLTGVIVNGGYYIFNVPMKNMYGTPKYVGGNFFCADNGLETLEGATPDIGGGFSCKDNNLKDLRHGPKNVGADYIVENNKLENVEGAPENLRGIFNIAGNPGIRDFEHAPKTFRELRSDHGVFASWDEVPTHLLQSEDKILRIAHEFREQVKAVVREAGTLSRPVAAPKTASFARKS